MSSLRNAISRRAHKERAQPHDRRKFGLLEKHKDYVIRANAYHKKQETLNKLKEKAAFRNSDEFYFKMVNTRMVDGVHRPPSEANKYNHEELMMMQTQDVAYCLQKMHTEKKKIERLSSTLHLLDNPRANNHVYFAEDREEAKEIASRSSKVEKLPVFEDLPSSVKRKTASSYKSLEARKARAQTLESLYMDMALKKELQKKGRKRKLREDEVAGESSKPVYKWRMERKR